MRTIFIILLVLTVYSFYSSADKLSKMKKNARLRDEYFAQANADEYPAHIIESVRSNNPDTPKMKIRLANADDDDDATVSIVTENEQDDDDDEEEEEDLPIKKIKSSKSKIDDIHSFL
ncbi:unnamed protein product [Rotaria magnacalcarata]|uniref:Uncharacterized protein n=4 Tax=Rotaria magnacalcarata TaxID=392030 RepID=A0A816LW78_9BILA|nr:unnamed protein product [Rotaria magnacalcarata]CAF1951184.1 unnamed protein product [Rotaria magnacalcarata]